jgi:hypothetical protein
MAIVVVIGSAFMANVLKAVLDLPFAVLKRPNVAGKQRKPFGVQEDGELPTGNVLSVQVPSIVARAISATMVAVNRISQKQNGNVKMILSVIWVFVRNSNVLNAEALKIALSAGLVITAYVLKAVTGRENVLEINQFARVHLAIALNVQAHLIVLTVIGVIITIVFGRVVQEMIAYVLWVTIVTFRNVLRDVEVVAIVLLVGLIAVRQLATVKNAYTRHIVLLATNVRTIIVFGSV